MKKYLSLGLLSILIVSGFFVSAGTALAVVAPIVSGTPVTSVDGTTIIITFDKPMNNPSAFFTDFTATNGIGESVMGAALHSGDNTKIDLTLGTPILNGQTVTVSYGGSDVTSVDTGVLVSFGPLGVTNNVPGGVATIVSAKITSPTQFTIVYSNPVDAAYTDYSSLSIDGHAATSVDGMTGTGTATHVITFTPSVALTTASTGVVNIAALADGGSGNTFAGQAGQVLADGQTPTVTGVAYFGVCSDRLVSKADVSTSSCTVSITFSEAMDSLIALAADGESNTVGNVLQEINPGDGESWDGTNKIYTFIVSVVDSGEQFAGQRLKMTGATDTAGNTMADYYTLDNFTVDMVAPTITSTAPATSAHINSQKVNYTLSEPVSTSTIVFTGTAGPDNAVVHTCTLQGTALNTGAHTALTLATDANVCVAWTALVTGSTYTVTFDATDVAGNPATQVSNTGVVYDTTGASTPSLGAAATFGSLSGTYTNTVTGTTINGDLGYTTGPAWAPTVTGTTHVADGTYTQAGLDQGTALTNLNGQSCTSLGTNVTLSGTYTPGCYSSSGTMDITASATITLNGAGTYIFRSGGALTTGASSIVALTGGAYAGDVFWTPGAAASLGATSTFKGTIIDNSGITVGSTVAWVGRALSSATTVTTDTDTITVPTPTLAFTDNVAAGPVVSDTITATWGAATITKWDYNATNVCPTSAGSYSNTGTSITTQTDATNNGKYVCLYGEDAAGSKSTLASANPINVDSIAPTVTTVAVTSGLTVDVTFSQAMGTGVTTASNYTVSGTGKGTLATNPTSVVLSSGNTYTLTWATGEMKNGGDITITVAAGVQDVPGNPMGVPDSGTHTGGGIGVVPTFTVTSVSPASGNTAKIGGFVDVTITAGGSETGLTASGVQTVNGVTSTFAEVGGGVYGITYHVVEGNTDISDAAALPVSITLKDAAGNVGTTITTIVSGTAPGIDAHKPTPAITTSPASIYEGALTTTVQVNYGEGMNPATTPVITLTGTHWGAQTPVGGGWSAGNSVYTATFLHTAFQENISAEIASIAAGSGATDAAGNPENGGSSPSFVVDTVKPTVASVTSDGATYNLASSNPTIKVTFNEDIDISTPPTIAISHGGGQTVNNCADGDAKTWCFTYTLQSEDLFNELIEIYDSQDTVGNTMDHDNLHSFYVDRVAPTVTIDAPAIINNTNKAAYTLTGTCSENGRTVSVNIDGGTVTASPTCTLLVWTTTNDVSAIADNAAVPITADQTDAAGNSATQAVSATLKNTTPPATPTIDVVATDDIINAAERTATVTVTGGNEAGSTVTLNGNTTVVDSPTTWHYILTAVAIDAFGQGSETLTAVATNAAGNPDIVNGTKNIFVDTIAPVVTGGNIYIQGNNGLGGAFKQGDVPVPVWDDVSDGEALDTLASVTFDMSNFKVGDTTLPGVLGGYPSLPTFYSGTLSGPTDAQDDVGNTVTVTVTDEAGNITSTAETSTYTVDTIAPIVTAGNVYVTGATGAGGVFKNGDTPILHWGGDADGETDTIAAVTFDASSFASADSVRAALHTSGVNNWSIGLSGGLGGLDPQNDVGNTITVTVEDGAGNFSGPITSSVSYAIDTIAPTGVVTLGINPITISTTTQTVHVAYSEPMDPASTPTITFTGASGNFAYNLDGSWDAATTTWTGTYTYDGTAQQTTGGAISAASSLATDAVGNAEGVGTPDTFDIDTIAPVVNYTYMSINHSGCTTGTCKIGDTVIFNWDNSVTGDGPSNPDIASVVADLSQFGGSATAPMTDGGGGHFSASLVISSSDPAVDNPSASFSVIATDNAGNTGNNSSSDSASVDNRAPTVTDGNISISGHSGAGGVYKIADSVIVTWDAASDSNSDIVSATADLSGWGGSATTAMNDSGAGCDLFAGDGSWCASYSINGTEGIENTGVNTTVTAIDNAGNTTGPVGDTTGATVDTIAPTSAVASLSTDPVTLTNNTQTVSLTYSEAMDPLSTPTITFTGASGTFTSAGPGVWSGVGNTVYTESFTHDGTPEETTGVSVSSTGGATDVAGNAEGASTPSTFNIDTVAPVVNSATIDVGSGTGGTIIAGNTPTITIIMSEPVAGFTSANVITPNGTFLGGLSTSDNITFTGTFVPDTVEAPINDVVVNTAFTDIAGNTAASGASSGDFAIDTILPTLGPVSIVSNNASTTLAKSGDTVTLSFSSSETLFSDPNATIDGQVATIVNVGGNNYTATYLMTGTEGDTPVSFTIDFTDAAGNAGTEVSTVTDTSSVTTDFTIPTVSYIDSGAADATFNASDIGTTIPIRVNFSENVYVTGIPTLTLATGGAGTDVDYSNGDGDSTFNFDYAIQAGNISADLDYASTTALVGTITDAAGNTADLTLPVPGSVNSLGGQKNLIIDTVAPTLNPVSIVSDNASTTLAKVGDIVTLSFTASETLNALPTVTIDGNPADAVNDLGSGLFSATRVMQAGDSETAVGFSIDFTDVAGNAGATVTTVTDVSSVTFDETPPTVAITDPVASQSVNASYVITFTDNELTAPECSVDNANWYTCTSSVTTLDDITEFAGLPEGSFTLYLRDTDPAGNTGTDNVSLVIKDTTAPVITLIGSNPQSVTKGGTYTEAGATALDAVDGTVTVIPSGSVNTSVIGSYVITYTATDAALNSTTTTRIVNVVAQVSSGGGRRNALVTPITLVGPPPMTTNQFIQLLIDLGIIPPNLVFLVKIIFGLL